MLANHAIVAFVATCRPAEARAFYETTLGLSFVSDDPYAIAFEAHGTMLRVQKVESHSPASHTVLGWRVPDIAAAVRALVARGVTFERFGFLEQDALGVWSSPSGAKVAWLKDPDGNTLSLTQL